MRRGDLAFMTSFSHMPGPGTRFNEKMPKGQLAVFVLIGTMEARPDNNFDVEKAMRDLGWVREGEKKNA